MPEVLNLDEFIPEKRFLTLAGREYQVLEMCVEAYLGFTKTFKRLQEAQAAGDEAAQVEASLEIARTMVPELPAGTLERLPIRALERVTTFLLKPLVAEVAAGGEGGEGPPLADEPPPN